MAESLPSIRFSTVSNKPRPLATSFSLPPIMAKGLMTAIAGTTDAAGASREQLGKPPARRARKVGIHQKWWERGSLMPGKKDRPQYVPQPLAVHAPVSQKERKDGPRFLPPLAESISSIRKVPAAHELQRLQAIAAPDHSTEAGGANLKGASRRPMRQEAHLSTVVTVDLLPLVPIHAPTQPVVLPLQRPHKFSRGLRAGVARGQQLQAPSGSGADIRIGGLPVILIDGSWVGGGGPGGRPRSCSTITLPTHSTLSFAEGFKHRRRASDSVYLARRAGTSGVFPLHAVDMGAFYGTLPIWLQRVRDTLSTDGCGQERRRRLAGNVRQLMAVLRGKLCCGSKVLSEEEQANVNTVGKLFETLAAELAIIDLNAQYMEGLARPTWVPCSKNKHPRRPPRVCLRNAAVHIKRTNETSGDMRIVGSDGGYLKSCAVDDHREADEQDGTDVRSSDGGDHGNSVTKKQADDDGPLAHPSHPSPPPYQCDPSSSSAHVPSTSTAISTTSNTTTSTSTTTTTNTSTITSHLLTEYKISSLDARLRQRGLKVYTEEESRNILENVQRDLAKLGMPGAPTSTKAASAEGDASMETKKRGLRKVKVKVPQMAAPHHSNEEGGVPNRGNPLRKAQEGKTMVEVEEEMERDVEGGEGKGVEEEGEREEVEGEEGEGEEGEEEGEDQDTFMHDNGDMPQAPAGDVGQDDHPPNPAAGGHVTTPPDSSGTDPTTCGTPNATRPGTTPPGHAPLSAPDPSTISASSRPEPDTAKVRRQDSRPNITRSTSRKRLLGNSRSVSTYSKGHNSLRRQPHVSTPPDSPEFKTGILKEISDIQEMVRGVREAVGGGVVVGTIKQPTEPSRDVRPTADPHGGSTADTNGGTPHKVHDKMMEEVDQRVAQELRKKAMEKEIEERLEEEKNEVVRRRQQEANEREKAKKLEREAKQQQLLLKAQEELQAAAEKERKDAVLQRLRRELEWKHVFQTYIAETLACYNRDVQVWEEADYAYIEQCLGAQRCQEIKSIEKERLLEEKKCLEDQLNRALEYKKQELLLRLQEAQRQFYDSVQREKAALETVLKLSPAFVFSYFAVAVEPRMEAEL